MSTNKEHKAYTAEDIARYHAGSMSREEMHALEKATLEDPFLEDALEGYTVPGVEPVADMEDLKARLQDRIGRKGSASLFVRPIFWRAAAVVILVSSIGWLAVRTVFSENDNAVAVREQGATDSVRPAEELQDQAKTAFADTTPSSGIVDGTVPSTTDKNATVAIGAGTKEPGEQRPSQAKTSAKAGYRPTPDSLTPPSGDFVTIEKNKPENTRIAAPQAATTSAPLTTDTKSESLETGKRSLARQKEAGLSPVPPSHVFNGRVTDAKGNPLPFANVTNVADHVGTYADARGYFNLISSDSTMKVQVRSLGFDNDSFRLNAGTALNKLVLREDTEAMDNEIVLSSKRVNSKNRQENRVLEEPEPADGWYNYDSYLANNIVVPDEVNTRPASTAKEVQVSFEVDASGEPINIRIEKSLCARCDQEAIRLIKEGPRWRKKAKKAGNRVTVTIPF